MTKEGRNAACQVVTRLGAWFRNVVDLVQAVGSLSDD
jgi:hypothetical protein